MHEPKRGQPADELEGARVEHKIIRHLPGALEKFHHESHQPTHDHRPHERHPKQFSKRRVVCNLAPGHPRLAPGVLLIDRRIRHLVNEPKTHQAHAQAEGKEQGKLLATRMGPQNQRGENQGHQAPPVVHSVLPCEITAARILRDQARDPREPPRAGDAAHKVETKQRTDHNRQLALRIDPIIQQRHGNQRQDKQKANCPAGGDEAFIANATHMIGGRNLKDHHDRREPGYEAHDRCARAEAIRIKKDGGVHHNHAREKVEKEKNEKVIHTFRKLGTVGASAQAVFLAVVPATPEGRNDSSKPAQTRAMPR